MELYIKVLNLTKRGLCYLVCDDNELETLNLINCIGLKFLSCKLLHRQLLMTIRLYHLRIAVTITCIS